MNELDSARRGGQRPPLDPRPHSAVPRKVNLVSWRRPVVDLQVQELGMAVSRNYGSPLGDAFHPLVVTQLAIRNPYVGQQRSEGLQVVARVIRARHQTWSEPAVQDSIVG